MSKEKIFQLALIKVDKLGIHSLRLLLSRFESAGGVFDAPLGDLEAVTGISSTIARKIRQKETLAWGEKTAKECEEKGMDILFFSDEAYPDTLRHIYSPPLLLYVKGNVRLLQKKQVALVGTRKMTSYGVRVIKELIQALREHDVGILSGLGYGVEKEVTEQALAHDLPCTVILPSAIDKVYPATTPLPLLEKMMTQGCLLSEYPPSTHVQSFSFIVRNRLLAGLSQAMVLIESAEEGGALRMMHMAFSYDRAVFAVPGALGRKSSEGCHALIKESRANLLSSPSDLLESLGLGVEMVYEQPRMQKRFSEEEQKIINILAETREGMLADALATKTAISTPAMSALLLSLELLGVVEALPGKKYKIL